MSEEYRRLTKQIEDKVSALKALRKHKAQVEADHLKQEAEMMAELKAFELQLQALDWEGDGDDEGE